MHPQSTAQRQTREIKARYLTAGMTVIDGDDGPLIVTSVNRPSADRALVSFEGQPEPTLFDLEVGVTIVHQQDWYFTFGSAQQHDGKYVVIPGSHDEARDEMFRHFGNRWSFQYASPERAGVEQFGLVELPRNEWPAPVEPTVLSFGSFNIQPLRLGTEATTDDITEAIGDELTSAGYDLDVITLRIADDGRVVEVLDSGDHFVLGTVTISRPDDRQDGTR